MPYPVAAGLKVAWQYGKFKVDTSSDGIKKVHRRLMEKDGERCFYCNRKLSQFKYLGGTLPPDARTIDHVYPRIRGGETTFNNLVIACFECNIRKGDLLFTEFVSALPIQHVERIKRSRFGPLVSEIAFLRATG